jgi:hypothetical protein
MFPSNTHLPLSVGPNALPPPAQHKLTKQQRGYQACKFAKKKAGFGDFACQLIALYLPTVEIPQSFINRIIRRARHEER